MREPRQRRQRRHRVGERDRLDRRRLRRQRHLGGHPRRLHPLRLQQQRVQRPPHLHLRRDQGPPHRQHVRGRRELELGQRLEPHPLQHLGRDHPLRQRRRDRGRGLAGSRQSGRPQQLHPHPPAVLGQQRHRERVEADRRAPGSRLHHAGDHASERHLRAPRRAGRLRRRQQLLVRRLGGLHRGREPGRPYAQVELRPAVEQRAEQAPHRAGQQPERDGVVHPGHQPPRDRLARRRRDLRMAEPLLEPHSFREPAHRGRALGGRALREPHRRLHERHRRRRGGRAGDVQRPPAGGLRYHRRQAAVALRQGERLQLLGGLQRQRLLGGHRRRLQRDQPRGHALRRERRRQRQGARTLRALRGGRLRQHRHRQAHPSRGDEDGVA